MKIALITPLSGTVGGPSNYIAGLNRELLALGHRVSVISTDASTGMGAIHRRSPLRDLRLFHALRQLKPDIVHLHGRIHFLPAALLFRTIHPTAKIVFTFHTQPHVKDYLPGIHTKKPGYKRVSRSFVSALLRRCDAVTAVSRSIVENLNTYYSLDITKFDVIPSGGDPNLIRQADTPTFRSRHELENNSPILASVGVMSWDSKVAGYLVCIDAVALLTRIYSGVVLLIAGDGQYRNYLEAYARSRGVERHVKFLGTVANSGDVLAVADLYLQLFMNEGCSLALIEAMLAEKPIIASRCGGHTEVVEDGVSARVIEPNATLLTSTVIELMHDPQKRVALASEARRTALRFFTWPVVAESYQSLYEKVLAQQ